MLKVSRILSAGLQKISTQDAVDRDMFGPVFHGTNVDTFDKIKEEGFRIPEGEARTDGSSNGYDPNAYVGQTGIPAPVHHLGYGAYFTTNKSIAKDYSQGNSKTLKPYYLDVHNICTINFGSESNMMKWWVQNGYDP